MSDELAYRCGKWGGVSLVLPPPGIGMVTNLGLFTNIQIYRYCREKEFEDRGSWGKELPSGGH